MYLFIKPIVSRLDIMPLPGIPSLVGILKEKNITCEYIDLDAINNKNIEIENIVNYIVSIIDFYKNIESKNCPINIKERLLLHKSDFFKGILWLRKNISKLNLYKKLNKNSSLMYSYIYYYYYLHLILKIKEQMVLFDFYMIFDSDRFIININNIYYLMNSPFNILKDFYKEQVKQIINKKPDIIGVQILREEDFIPGLFLCYEIKKQNSLIHINIGGNLFESYEISNIKDLFNIFFDSISIGDSTKTVVDLVKYIKGEISIEEVSNLMYLKNNEVKFNKDIKLGNINRLAFQSFDYINKEDYILPQLVLPVRASTTYSCYWGKCIYCNCSGMKSEFRLKSAKRLVEEIEYLSKKYNTKYFTFWDNAMHPKYLEKVADLLISKKLKIKYSLYARLEEEFSLKLLKKIKKSGCVLIHWGLDSASQKICDYIKKGININTAKLVLQNSSKAGIANFVYLIFGLPTESMTEVTENLKFIKENKHNIDEIAAVKNVFFLKGSLLYEKYEYYKSLINTSDEYIDYKNQIIEEIRSILKISSPEKIIWLWEFLYIEKYGILRFRLLKYLIFNYCNSNKIIKRILNYYLKFVTNNLKNILKDIN